MAGRKPQKAMISPHQWCQQFPPPATTLEIDDQLPTVASRMPSPGAASIAYLGPTSIEERILASPVIAKVRLDSTTAKVESGTTYRGMKSIAVLEFSFSVLEYLKGSGTNDIVALWAAPFFDTQEEAEAALPTIAAARDTRWDNREAIVFLQHPATYLPSTLQAGRFFLSGEHLVGGIPDDYYSLASRGNKLWLPAEAALGASSQPSGDEQRFLMDMPPATGIAPTITLGEIKTRVAAVTAKLDAGDGSEEYRECVQRTYQYKGDDSYIIETGGEGLFYRTPDQEIDSGLAASTVVYEAIAYGGLPNERAEVWLDRRDADLFSVEFSDGVPHDFSGDGTHDSIEYAQRVVSARPLPLGVYRTQYNNRDAHFVPCAGYASRHESTVTATAPEGTLHEAFFDPVVDGTAVAADATNGVLKPVTFTDANGRSATIQRIAWEAGTGESGTVKLKVSPHAAVANHIVDFIALDGSVPLSLDVSEATVDAANHTLSWTVTSQPWQGGDQLMVRIREAPDCSNGTVVPNPSANPGLVADCSVLLDIIDRLRGTASLNWSVDTAIDRWDGVTVEGAPKRVTILDLSSHSLTGTIPAILSRLTGLLGLHLANNRLTGSIPSELGALANLETLRLNHNSLIGPIPTQLADLPNLETLYLSGNSLTGCPVALEGVSTNDLSSLNLLYCQPPAQEALAGTAGESSVALSWNSVSNASGYRVEYRLPSPADWSLFSDALTYKQTEPSPPLTFPPCPSPAPLIRCNQPSLHNGDK